MAVLETETVGVDEGGGEGLSTMIFRVGSSFYQ
jgi:hypothetical protein